MPLRDWGRRARPLIMDRISPETGRTRMRLGRAAPRRRERAQPAKPPAIGPAERRARAPIFGPLAASVLALALLAAAPARAHPASSDGEVSQADYDKLLGEQFEEIPFTKPGTTKPLAAGAAPKPEPATIPPRVGGFKPDAEMYLCPRLNVSNAPPHGESLLIEPYRPIIDIDGVELAIAPLNNGCLSSGFGPRGAKGRLHKGVDYFARPAVMVYAAGEGVIREAHWRDDYGYQIVIDHGSGVFTRYAHLRKFEAGVEAGQTVSMGTPLGFMGNTSKYKMPLHLHFEVMTGDYDTPKKSFGLKPIDPFQSIGG